jgi:hypothetical protein
MEVAAALVASELAPERAVDRNEADLDEFICPICYNIVPFGAAAYTKCSHMACMACLRGWLGRGGGTCPKCSSQIRQEEVMLTQHAVQALHRMLGRIVVSTCGRHSQGHEAARFVPGAAAGRKLLKLWGLCKQLGLVQC